VDRQDFNWKSSCPAGAFVSGRLEGSDLPALRRRYHRRSHADVASHRHGSVAGTSATLGARTIITNTTATQQLAGGGCRAVYVCWSTPEEFSVLAFDHDGKQLWKTDLGEFVSQHGGGSRRLWWGIGIRRAIRRAGELSLQPRLGHGELMWKVARGRRTSFPRARRAFISR